MTSVAVMFGAPFMQYAAAAIAMLAVCAAVVGLAVNLRALEFVTDGLVHAVFPGVVIGALMAGADGIYLGAVIAALAATVLLTLAAARGLGSDATTAVMLAGAFALGVVIISASGSTNAGLENLLFGHLLTVTANDLIAIAVLGGLAVLLIALTWKQQLFLAFDRLGMRASGFPVLRTEFVLNFAIALVVVAAARAVGNLLVLAIVIVPVAIGRLISMRLGRILAISIAVALIGSMIGLTCGYWLTVDAEIPASPSSVLVLVLVAIYLAVLGCVQVARRVRA